MKNYWLQFKDIPKEWIGEKWVAGRFANKGKTLPRVKFICDATIVPHTGIVEVVVFVINKMRGINECWEFLQLKQGDCFAVGLSAFAVHPKIGEHVCVSLEHYVTSLGYDQYRYVGRIVP